MTAHLTELRDLFAALALPGVVARNCEAMHEEIAAECYALADALLEERLRTLQPEGVA